MSPNQEKLAAQAAILGCIKRFMHQQLVSIVPEVEMTDLDSHKDLSSDHWVASVLLNTSKAQVLLRVHFSSASGRAILARNLQEDPKLLQPASAHDFLKETCNVVMGKLKGILVAVSESDDAKRVFLPNIEPSFDKYGVVPGDSEMPVEESWWRIFWSNGGELVAYARATASTGFSEDTMEALSHQAIVSVNDLGDIDFL